MGITKTVKRNQENKDDQESKDILKSRHVKLDPFVCPIYKHTELDMTCDVNEVKVVTEKVMYSSKLRFQECMLGCPQVLDGLLQAVSFVFDAPTGLPPIRSHDHAIQLTTGVPICVRPYCYPHIQKTEIERQVRDLLSLGMIRPSQSAYSSPAILVRKNDNSWRMCVDYRALNNARVPDKYPIPVVEELLDELYGSLFFTKLDLKSGYNQIRMHSDSIEKTAFRTHDGHYEFLVLPFGLTNAPATFQAVMNDIFRPLLRRKVVIFFDDILIYIILSMPLTDLQLVFSLLSQHICP
ncbi:hypothetical protein E3N88_40081 [Mikania micrantha]|uniref:Reverse transcriptase domain-containing protein n=1 Tax=Mikania micrantha TaxID=192012 RepID=A0A5N6LLR5_9ASTR|nr:hypothetical protein E3N88_40081 [Mikania micrantha]